MNETPKVIDHDQLMVIKKKLKELPKVKRVKTYSDTEAVEALAGEIKSLSNKGYEIKEIVDFLKEEGIEASVTRVKKILATPRVLKADPGHSRKPEGSALNQENAQRIQEALADELEGEPGNEAEGAPGEAEKAPETPDFESSDTAEPAHKRGRHFLEAKLNGKEAQL